MVNQSWLDRVDEYLDQLESVTTSISEILESSRVATVEVKGSPEPSTDRLMEALGQLEVMIADREALLTASDAPTQGSTLTEKLRNCKLENGSALARRCDRVAETVAMTNQRAVSLFVCQYHLADFGAEIIRLLSGADAPATYGNSTPNSGGGSLFNEAA